MSYVIPGGFHSNIWRRFRTGDRGHESSRNHFQFGSGTTVKPLRIRLDQPPSGLTDLLQNVTTRCVRVVQLLAVHYSLLVISANVSPPPLILAAPGCYTHGGRLSHVRLADAATNRLSLSLSSPLIFHEGGQGPTTGILIRPRSDLVLVCVDPSIKM